jgi:hypothetical protein
LKRYSYCPEKRSRALRGRNPTRDNESPTLLAWKNPLNEASFRVIDEFKYGKFTFWTAQGICERLIDKQLLVARFVKRSRELRDTEFAGSWLAGPQPLPALPDQT